jgi:transposase-like protein
VGLTNAKGAGWLVRKHLEPEAGGELLGEMVKMAAELLMDAEVDVLCDAGYGERSDARVNSRNGRRRRRWDTRAGTITLGIPKLRRGSYFPSLLEPRRRAEQALMRVVCQASVEGVSTRRVDDLVRSMGIEGMSKSQVLELAKTLDHKVAELRSRGLDPGPPTDAWLDALVHKVREGGRVVSVATVIATGVNADGHREILGIDVFITEDGVGWTASLRGLVARGLFGAALVVSDAHEGLKHAIAAVLPGATWQRCRAPAMRINLLTRVPTSAQAMVATLVRTIFAQSDAAQLKGRFPAAAEFLIDAEADLLAFSSFPVEHWRQIWSNNGQDRLNKGLLRRTDVVGIFPNRPALIRLCGAVLAEQHDEWALARRSMSAESLAKARLHVVACELDSAPKEVEPAELEAVS